MKLVDCQGRVRRFVADAASVCTDAGSVGHKLFHKGPACLPDRFFHPSLAGHGSISIEGTEAHHLIHVLRAKPGLEVILFDGSGAEFLARVERVERSTVRLAVVESREVDRELPVSVTLGVALPKGDRQRWLVEKATELGITRLTPLVTARGVAQPTRETLRRLERAVIEASKQCGRNRLMQIAVPVCWSDFLLAAGSATKLFADPGGSALSIDLLSQFSAALEILLAIGPEGGLTDAEVDEAVGTGWQAVDLGRRILRIETAAIALVAAVTLPIPRPSPLVPGA
ncbi:MAG TPA: 16S rRNA (uracil(1498)-N(3))-methyltransferase [Pirellulales bacterium]|nr:16S rRNA (uracil(1498)-N(3))-methyltransferase [Pirellulales bacterium]